MVGGGEIGGWIWFISGSKDDSHRVAAARPESGGDQSYTDVGISLQLEYYAT